MPQDPDFWEEVHAFTTHDLWQAECAKTLYSPPTDQQIIADLAAAIRLGFRPAFAGSPAWARQMLRNSSRCTTPTSGSQDAEGIDTPLATIHQISDAPTRATAGRQPENLVQH